MKTSVIFQTLRVLVFIFAIGFPSINTFAQDKSVTLVVSGEATTKGEATKQALRSAIEQAFGTFVSANTEILNDQIIKDEIVTISSGNIEHYKEINSFKNADGTCFVTVEATVSIGKLTNYAKSKGMKVELATGAFAMNMKIRELNKQNEVKALADLQEKIRLMSKGYKFFDYKLKLSEPYQKGNNYAITATIEIKPNGNLVNFRNTIVSTLKALSLTREEQEEYTRAHIPFKSINIREYESDAQMLNTICVPYPNQRKDARRYSKIALRNTDSHYPSLYSPTQLLKNELQFAIKDNLGNVFATIYANHSLKDELVIAHSKAPLWAVYCFNEKYRNDKTESYDFAFGGITKGEKPSTKIQTSCFYQLDEDTFDLLIWDYKNMGFGISPEFKYEIEYSKEDFTKVNSIELSFSQPYYLE